MTSHGLYCSLFSACTHHLASCNIPTFGVCLRHFSVLRWKNMQNVPQAQLAPHGGITFVVRVFGSQHCIVSNSYKLVRASTLTEQPLSLTQESNGTLQSPLSSISSQVPDEPHTRCSHTDGATVLCASHTPRFYSGRLHVTLHLGVSPVEVLPDPQQYK